MRVEFDGTPAPELWGLLAELARQGGDYNATWMSDDFPTLTLGFPRMRRTGGGIDFATDSPLTLSLRPGDVLELAEDGTFSFTRGPSLKTRLLASRGRNDI